MDFSYLDKNIAEVRARIDRAREAAGRSEEVTLIAAVKSGEVEEINYLHRALGVNDIGENRVQQLLDRYEAYDREGLRIHFIGHLQTNKVKYIIDKVHMIQSLDSERLAVEIERQAARHGLTVNVLVEINSGREQNKDGVMPEDAAALCERLSAYPHIRLCGFMTMAPVCEDEAEYRKYFDEISALAVDIWTKTLHNIGEPILSMGMSESFEAAIASGATAVRVGRRLFVKESIETQNI